MDDADRLDLVPAIFGQAGLDRGRVGPVAPIAGQELNLQTQPLGYLTPQRSEVAGLAHHHPVAGRQRVDQRRFPRAGAGRRIDDYWFAGLENPLDAGQHLAAEPLEFRPAVIDGRQVDGPQHPIRHISGPWNL